MPTTTTAATEAAAIPLQIVEAWKHYDASSFATVFAEDGTMTMPGVFQRGRDAIEAFMTQGFAGPYQGTVVEGTPFDIQVISPDVVVLTTEGGVRPVDAEEVDPGNCVRATWVVVRQSSGWRLASYTNTPKFGN